MTRIITQIIIITTVFLTLFPVTGSADVDRDLKGRFNLYLLEKADTLKWSDIEKKYILDSLLELPKKLTTSGSKIVLYKKKSRFEKYISKGCRTDYNYIEIFQKKEIERTIKKTKNIRSKELINFIIKRGLAVPENTSKHTKKYLSYIMGRVLLRYLLNYDKKHKISEKSKWLKISQWKRFALIKVPVPFMMKSENSHLKGFAHPEGMISPAMDFASFGAVYFETPVSLFSESIKCTNPLKYRFFRKLFLEYAPHLDNPEFEKRGIRCLASDFEMTDKIRFTDIHTGEKINIGPINKDTVEGFELIYATPGDREISEIAGHLMLRVKLKNNKGKRGFQNPYDLIIAVLADNKEHLKGDAEVKNSKTKSDIDPCSEEYKERAPQFHELFNSTKEALFGLAGGFRTIFQIDTFQYAVNHYTVISNRTLERYELTLNERQKEKLINHLKTAVKNYKTDYWFFTRNCGSILVKLIGEAIEDEDIATYNTFVSPPNSLLLSLEKKKLLKPVFPHIYSYTAKAQIASDMIESRVAELRKKYTKFRFPSYSDFNSKDDEVRSSAYSLLYEIAVKEPKAAPYIIEIFKLAQRSELAYTWNKGTCIVYSTKTKGLVRDFIEELKLHDKKRVDISAMINSFDRKREEKDSLNGISHTGLSLFKAGYVTKEIENEAKSWSFVTGTVYSQKMGDISNFTMLRGTEVTLGEFEISYNDEDDKIGYSLTALKIRKIKARRHYVPSVFSIHRNAGLSFTILDVENNRDGSEYYRIVPFEIGGFISLYSSRLFLDHIIVSGGTSIETWADKDYLFPEELFNDNTMLGIPFGVESQITFGEKRALQLNLLCEYRYYLPFSGNYENFQPEDTLTFRAGFSLRLGEYSGTEVVLNSSYTFKKYRNNKNRSFDERTLKAALSFYLW